MTKRIQPRIKYDFDKMIVCINHKKITSVEKITFTTHFNSTPYYGHPSKQEKLNENI